MFVIVVICFLLFVGGDCYYVNSVVRALYLCAPFNVWFKVLRLLVV